MSHHNAEQVSVSDSVKPAGDSASMSSNFFSDKSLTSAMESRTIAFAPSEAARATMPELTITGEDQPVSTNDHSNGEQLIAKLPWEHPQNPQDAANHAQQEIRNLGGNRLAYNQAAAWLNDATNRGSASESDFRTRAANAFNALDIHVVGISGVRCSVRAEKVNGEIRVRENDCELQGY